MKRPTRSTPSSEPKALSVDMGGSACPGRIRLRRPCRRAPVIADRVTGSTWSLLDAGAPHRPEVSRRRPCRP